MTYYKSQADFGNAQYNGGDDLDNGDDDLAALDINNILKHKRLRRLRQSGWVRAMVCPTNLTANDLIWPLFLTSGVNVREPIASMPGVERFSVDLAVEAARYADQYGIPAIALFPSLEVDLRDERGSEALNPDNLVCRAIKAIRCAVPQIGVISDIALDPYTSHGHDGIMNGTEIVNDESVAQLCRQALNQARAGAQILAPSDMMDGRVGAIRAVLDDNGFHNVIIMSYAVKYASAFYGPFRDAVGTSEQLVGDKRTYQMDPGNPDEAMREVRTDIDEGADMIIVKPGMPYLDILYKVKRSFLLPVCAYQVSGEYAMISAAGENGWINRDLAIIESLIAFKRAGANAVLTYFAPYVAKWLKNNQSGAIFDEKILW